jgi:hypothetical protein
MEKSERRDLKSAVKPPQSKSISFCSIPHASVQSRELLTEFCNLDQSKSAMCLAIQQRWRAIFAK